jgi:hypothetical protein
MEHMEAVRYCQKGEATEVKTPAFVKVRQTGEVGRIFSVDSTSDQVRVEFFHSPSTSTFATYRSTELDIFHPEVNEIVWVPVQKDINGKKTRVFHRATF